MILLLYQLSYTATRVVPRTYDDAPLPHKTESRPI
jgi:hypothetical protein